MPGADRRIHPVGFPAEIVSVVLADGSIEVRATPFAVAGVVGAHRRRFPEEHRIGPLFGRNLVDGLQLDRNPVALRAHCGVVAVGPGGRVAVHPHVVSVGDVVLEPLSLGPAAFLLVRTVEKIFRIQVVLIQDRRPVGGFPVVHVDQPRRDQILIVVNRIGTGGKTDLTQIRKAADRPALLPRLRQARHQHRRQNCDDRDHNQKFD